MPLVLDGIRRSPRHRSGVAVRFPRIARWRSDKAADESDPLETLQALQAAAGSPMTT
jgi:DNA ligase-1